MAGWESRLRQEAAPPPSSTQAPWLRYRTAMAAKNRSPSPTFDTGDHDVVDRLCIHCGAEFEDEPDPL